MVESKRETLALLLTTLQSTRNCDGLKDLVLSVNEETVTAVYENASYDINVACDSCFAIILDVARNLPC